MIALHTNSLNNIPKELMKTQHNKSLLLLLYFVIALVKNKDNTFLLFFRKYPKAASDPVDIDGGKLEENFSNDKILFSSDNASSS